MCSGAFGTQAAAARLLVEGSALGREGPRLVAYVIVSRHDRPATQVDHMSDQRTHHVTTTDGVTIGGTVHGQGPPIVFWHGAYGDGALDWQALLPHLTDRFTCHLPSWRCRGLSGEHADLSYGRRVGDILAYVDSIGEPTGLVGWSGGANAALAAAAQSDAVNALAPFEPTVGSVMDEQDRVAFRAAVARMGELAGNGRLADALRAAARFPFSDEEVALVDDAGYFEAAARYVPNLLDAFRQLAQHEGPTADDPAVLGAISAPVLVVHGADTKPFWIRGARYVADHVPDARIQAIPGAGHAAPLTHPMALAEALTEFFSPAQQA
jgi:pimeloyl-ACP methyl ester carboxylesterase